MQEHKQASQRLQAFQAAQAEAEASLKYAHHSRAAMGSSIEELQQKLIEMEAAHAASQQVRFVEDLTAVHACGISTLLHKRYEQL